MTLETDRRNAAELADYHVRASVAHYQALMREGYPASCARQQAIAYLRRKTDWGYIAAASTLDGVLPYKAGSLGQPPESRPEA